MRTARELRRYALRKYENTKGKAETYRELELAIHSSLKKAKWMGNETEVLILEKAMKMYEEEIAEIKTLPLKGVEKRRQYK